MGSNYNIHIPSFLYHHRSWLVAKLCTALVNKTHTHMHVRRESPFPLFKIDIFHIRFYHAIAVTRHRYPLKNLSWVLHGISSSIGNLEDGGKSRGKGGRRTVDKLEIQRIEQLFYVSMGGRMDGWWHRA